ncbi:MAG: LLM class flavin-dependent oxidoreductase [Sphaerobacter sp.]|nr:LLM class flavin-dependent oxidoreductase [Sphaerobacter sp.]
MTNPLPPLFGLNIDPGTADPADPFRRARLADETGLDLITIQDHPYLATHFDTWTLLTALAGATARVRLGTNVSPLPARPPAMLAKAAATLDVLSGGRVELGIGAGGYPVGLRAFGAAPPPGGAAVAAFEECIRIIRGLWQSEGAFTLDGEHFRVRGARFGPRPAHPIRIWVGATRPRMLRLAGRLADGILVSNPYVPPERLPTLNRWVDEGAAAAGRPPTAIRRGYNLMGVIDLPGRPARADEVRAGTLVLPVDGWIAHLTWLWREQRIDTFIFWPLGQHQIEQAAVFAAAVAPAVREALGRHR